MSRLIPLFFASYNDASKPPPPCNLADDEFVQQPYSKHSLFARLIREEDVDMYAGNIVPPGQGSAWFDSSL
jgi:hypothetical protein